ncbi:TPA: hypothetical protein QHT00_001693 [Enterobacter sichuanensis]|uniref:hypothetical protein n=1 Tax=Enterobacter sichuanensis TaxID=2071710 RepID=UPI00277E739D|nr:hypothetical protein [Enterobacter sichuanensis]MEB5959862.1 hypothetical protein [Enterobacter sichuanensis]HDT1602615.1 hypothetical protein [Enterobacter sichuanensis]
MKGFIKGILKLLLEDLMNDLKAYGTVFVMVILSTIPATYIEDNKIAMLIIGVIVIVVFYIAYIYDPKG